MRKRHFSAGRTKSGAKSTMASVTLRMMASMGSFSSASKVALRGWNHSRSLLRAMPRRNLKPSGRRCAATGADGTGFAIRDMMASSLPDHLQRAAEQSVEVGGQRLVLGDRLVDGLLGGGPLVAQVGQRRQHIDRKS